MNVNILDIPRAYTGIAEWMACLVRLAQYEPRMPLRRRIPAAGIAPVLPCLVFRHLFWRSLPRPGNGSFTASCGRKTTRYGGSATACFYASMAAYLP